MAITRGPIGKRTSIPGKKTKIPASIRRSSAKNQVNQPSRKQTGASRKTKQQSAKKIISAKPEEGRLLSKRQSRSNQTHKDEKSAVEAKGATVSPSVPGNSRRRQSILSATFTKDKTPKENVLQKLGRRVSSNAETSPSQTSVQNERNKKFNVVPEASYQSPKKDVQEKSNMIKNKNKALPLSIMVAKRGSLQYLQEVIPKPPDSIESKRQVSVAARNKLSSEVKLRKVSKKIVKAKSVIARNSPRKFRRTSISIINTSTVKFSNKASSPSISIADSGSMGNSPVSKTSEENKSFAVYSKSAKGEADKSVPSRKIKKSKVKSPNAISNKDWFQAKAKNVAGDSKPAKEKADDLVSLSKVKISKVKSPKAVSIKGFKHSTGGKAKNVGGALKSAKEKASPKVKISKPGHVPSSQGVRRSIRERFPPCETWRGQRPVFQFKHGQGFVYAGISPGRKKDESARLSIQQRNEKSKTKKRKTFKSVPKTPVFDQSNKTEVDVTLHSPFDTVEWFAVAQGDKIPFHLAKTFVSEKITFGFLDIGPLERKQSQYSPEDNIHFVVVKGRLKVVIHRTEFVFERFDSFMVPLSVTYSIENLQKSKALLSFSTFKTSFFPHQKEKDD